MYIMTSNIDKVRIIVVGDSGVGKTCLTHLIACNESLIQPGWTVGCNIEIKLHEYKEGTPQQQTFFIELFDIGGSLNHKIARDVFYSPTNGIILVHDLTNRKSHENLFEWLFEILDKDGKEINKQQQRGATLATTIIPTSSSMSTDTTHNVTINSSNYTTISNTTSTLFAQALQNSLDNSNASLFEFEDFLGATQIPILVVGTKLDLLDERRQPAIKRAGSIAEKCGAEEIWLNCRDTRSLAAGTADAVKLARFFDCIIDKRLDSSSFFTSNISSNNSGFGTSDGVERRRYLPTTSTSTPTNSPETLITYNLLQPELLRISETSDLK